MPEEPRPEAPAGGLRAVHAAVREYWERTGVPERLAGGDPEGPVFRFTEGPPTANGAPHVGHLVARVLKDVGLRYRRMQGHRIVSAMAGWDCHGLPVELGIEKRLGLKSKLEIEGYGVARFNEACRASVLEVADVWIEMSRRLGYWLDYAHAYRTMDPPFIESVWWSLKQLHERGLLEKGYYVLPYCPRCETPLASHEVAQGYDDATDPSVTLRFRLRDPLLGAAPEYVLVWTTTPWTLPSNLLLAVRPELPYVALAGPGDAVYWIAEAARERYPELTGPPLGRREGRELAGRGYVPPFPFAGPGPGRYRVVGDGMVDAAEGTGFVHIAPSFGPDDLRIGTREGVGLFDPLDGRAVFGEAVPPVQRKWFKVADPILVEALRSQGDLVRAETLRHTYPFCWRCDTPLIYRALDSWFVRTSRLNARIVSHNREIAWHPEDLRDGRFGNFLTEAKDWALSRNRYWGTPLPVWLCPEQHVNVVGSFAELAERSGAPLPEGFDPHRAGVDPIRFPCERCGAEARREPYTIDGWYDSGSAPFAQFHYPFEPGPFDPASPLDYVAEGLDQTRGWFYAMHVLASALFDRPAFRVCVVNGMILDERGQKMSKSRGNVLDPMAALDRYGGDPLRWALLTLDYTEPARFGEERIRKAGSRSLSTLLNVLAFLQQNAVADGAALSAARPEPSAPLDRWILSRLETTRRTVEASLEGAEYRAGVAALERLVDDLSAWYLRRSRERFWSDGDPTDRASAYATLSYVLATAALLLAPFAPYTAEHLHLALLGKSRPEASDSVHARRWPGEVGAVDPELERSMEARRELVEIGRELRQRSQIRSRTPLPELLVAASAPPGPDLDPLVAEELHVGRVHRLGEGAGLPGPETDYVARRDESGRLVAALPLRIPPELVAEGWRREGLRRLQALRKELGLAFTEPIGLELRATGPLFDALKERPERLRSEVLAEPLVLSEGPPPAETAGWRSWTIDGEQLAVRATRGPTTAPAAA